MIAAPVDSPRRDFLKLLVAAAPVLAVATSLNVLNRMPQGAPQIDSQTYPDDCDPTHPFHFDFYLSTNIAIVNRVLLSFFLRAFRRSLAAVNTVTSGASSASSSASGAGDHTHTVGITGGGGAPPLDPIGYSITGGFGAGGMQKNSAGATSTQTSTADTGVNHSHGIAHTHQVTPTLVDGIFEGVVATGVTVKVNGVDRTAALGGGTGFTSNQTELSLLVAWLSLGAWNTIDLTPTGLGRITGHLTVVSYIQSA